ncbi:hypothetical protein Barb7_00780 [Bacteroidales bacterium Barb7]|nr:hypothetical protein Barb7_00780 [Bacteroidales bacterium Barb7]
MIGIFVGKRIVPDFGTQMRPERLDNGKDDAPRFRYHRKARHEVKETVRMSLIAPVEAVEVHHAQEQFVLRTPFRQVIDIRPRRIALVENVQPELLLLHRIRIQRVHILHHQLPARH